MEQAGPNWSSRVDDDVLVFMYSGMPKFDSLKAYARETVQHAAASGFTKVLSDLRGLEESPGAVERLPERLRQRRAEALVLGQPRQDRVADDQGVVDTLQRDDQGRRASGRELGHHGRCERGPAHSGQSREGHRSGGP